MSGLRGSFENSKIYFGFHKSLYLSPTLFSNGNG